MLNLEQNFREQDNEKKDKEEMKDIESKEKQEVVLTEEEKKGLIEFTKCLEDGHIDRAIEIKETFNFSEEIIQSPEIQEAAKKGFIKLLENGLINEAIKIQENFNFSEEINKSPEILEVVKKIFTKYSRFGQIGRAIEIQETFNFPEEIIQSPEIREAALIELTKRLENGEINEVIKIQKTFNFSKEIIQSPEIQEAVKKGFIKCLESRWISEAIKIKETFNLSGEIVEGEALKRFIHYLEGGWLDKAIEIQKTFNISEEIVEGEALKRFIHYLEDGWIDEAIKIQENFNISEEIILKYTSKMIDSKEWDKLFLIQSNLPEAQPLYQEFISSQKEISQDENLSSQEKQEAFEALASLAERGEDSITEEFVEIIKKRAKEQNEQIETESGLDNNQDSAYNILLLLDNPDSNKTLFSLLDNKSIGTDLKLATLKTLIDRNRNFLNGKNKEALREWLSSEELDWQDFRFIKAIQNNIPSSDLKEKSELSIAPALKNFKEKESLNQTWQKHYPNIPENIFLQLLTITKNNEELLNKFQTLYSFLKKEGTKKENLLYGIVNSLDSNPNILEALTNRLKEVDFSSKEDADHLSEVFRNTVFLDKITEITNDNNHQEEIEDEIKKVFSKEINNLEELKKILKPLVTKKIQEVLPNENITTDKIKDIEQEWGTFEPIFTYLGRFPNLKEYIAEMVVNFDKEEHWKEWRYDLEDENVNKQIGHLSEEQLKIWEGEYFIEIGEMMISEKGSNIPERIQDVLKDSILTHKHIFNPEMNQHKNEFIQETLERTYDRIKNKPDEKVNIIKEEIDKVKIDSENIKNEIEDIDNLIKVKQGLEKILSKGSEKKMTEKIKRAFEIFVLHLPKEMGNIVSEKCEKIGKDEEIKVDEIINEEMRQTLNVKISKLDNVNTKELYQKRKELKSTVDLLRLNNLSNELIVTNRIVEKEGEKGGEEISRVLNDLKKYFKDSPFLQDIKNVESSLEEETNINEKRRLAMIATDNPQMLWESGKYPLGSGSCQHYAEGIHNYAKMLMGYVGDANCKVTYLIDLNKLSQETKKELEEKEFKDMKNNIPAKELLNASIARSIIKMTKDKNDNPVIFLEPVYSKVNKSDNSMDNHFNLFVDSTIAQPMKSKLARGNGEKSVSIGDSRSPGGQYEDSNLNNVKFIL